MAGFFGVKERWVLGIPTENGHCPSCKRYNGMGWHDYGFFPKPRAEATYCGEYCNCEIRYSSSFFNNWFPKFLLPSRVESWDEWEIKHPEYAEIERGVSMDKNVKRLIDFFGGTEERGGAGSGNFGHEGRPGEVGGSGGGGGGDTSSSNSQHYNNPSNGNFPLGLKKYGLTKDEWAITSSDPSAEQYLKSNGFLEADGETFTDKGIAADMRAQIKTIGDNSKEWAYMDDAKNLSNQFLGTEYLTLGGGEQAMQLTQEIADQLLLKNDEEMVYMYNQHYPDPGSGAPTDAEWANNENSRSVKFFGGTEERGGPGSGNFGHEGRPGEIGGSGGGGGKDEPSSEGKSEALDNEKIFTAVKPEKFLNADEPAIYSGKSYASFMMTPKATDPEDAHSGKFTNDELIKNFTQVQIQLGDSGWTFGEPHMNKSPSGNYEGTVYAEHAEKELSGTLQANQNGVWLDARFQKGNLTHSKSDVARSTNFFEPVTARKPNDLTDDEAAFILAASIKEPNRRMFVKRSAEGKYRWFAWPAATAFMNRDNEIDSMKLFDKFIQHVEETQVWPFLTFFHLGSNFRMGEADFLARDGAAYLVSGLFDDTKLAQSAINTLSRDTEGFWGTSIQYTPLGQPTLMRKGEDMIPIYEDGIHIEVSILPEQAASSLFTAIPVSPEIERSSSMNALVKAALSKLIGDDEVFRSELETMIDGVNRAASAPDAIVREVQSATPVPADTVTREEPPPNAPDVAVEPDAGTNAPPKSQFTSDQLNEIANSLIGNQQFLAALVSAVQAQDAAGAVEEVPPPPPAAVAQSMQIPPEVEEIMRAQKQAIDTLSAQVSQLAENAIVNLAEQPRRTERARDAIAVELSAPVGKNGKLDLGVKAASVLTKMGPPKTNK